LIDAKKYEEQNTKKRNLSTGEERGEFIGIGIVLGTSSFTLPGENG